MHRRYLIDRLAQSFPSTLPHARRCVGREAEYPVVDQATGMGADVRKVLRTMIDRRRDARGRPWLNPSQDWDGDGPMVVTSDAGVVYTVEVGTSTVEIAHGPYPDLHALRAGHEAAVAPVVEAAAALGAVLLGCGVQPKTEASAEIMTPKPHYAALHRAIGAPWLNFTVTASDQLHIDVRRDETILQTNLHNLLAPVIIALCGNSSIYADASGDCCVRETAMAPPPSGVDGIERYGMPRAPFADFDDFVTTLAALPVLLLPGETDSIADRRAECTGRTLRELYEAGAAGGDDRDEQWRHFMLHDHCALV